MIIDNPGTLRDPVHGTVQVGDLEWLLLESEPMQRLRGIRQLGLVEAVYPGAGHTRFEHSVGTMHMAGRLASQLGSLQRRQQRPVWLGFCTTWATRPSPTQWRAC